MAKMWVNNASYVRRDLPKLIASVANHDEYKKTAEKRMAHYDKQPVIVRKLIGELGMLNATRFKRTTKEKCDAIREAHQRKLIMTSVEIDC